MGFKDGRQSERIVDDLTTVHGERGAIFYMLGIVQSLEDELAYQKIKIDDRDRTIRQLRDAEAERSEYPVDVRLVDVTAERDEYERAFKELRKLVEQTLPCDRGR